MLLIEALSNKNIFQTKEINIVKQLKQRSVLLLTLVTVLCVAAVATQAATLNVTVTDAQTGEKTERCFHHRYVPRRDFY